MGRGGTRLLYRTILLASLAFALLIPLRGAGAAETRQLTLSTGHSIVLRVAGLTRVGVGDGRIVGVAPLANSEVVINGKSPGRTTVFLWTASRRDTYEVIVTDQALDDLAQMLRSSIKVPGVRVVTFNRSILVNGTVDNAEQDMEISELVARFSRAAEANNYTVVDAVTVGNPLGKIDAGVTAVHGAPGISVERDRSGNLIVSGRVHDRSEAETVLARVRAEAGPLLAPNGKIIDRLAVATTSQIDIKVYVLEVDKTAQSNLGIALQAATPTSGASSGGTTIGGQTYTIGNPSFPFLEDPSKVTQVGHPFNIGPFARIALLAPVFNLLLLEGHARVLSSPDLVTLPGSNATFLVGGQIPVPQSNGLGTVAVVYKDFGVKLDVTPTLLGDGSIETKINPEISNLDFTDGVTVNGFNIPALKISRLSTDVITKSGESIVLGGLLNRMESKNIQKIPLLGDLPILGQLFRSTSYLKSESDVVFVMTPQLLVR